MFLKLHYKESGRKFLVNVNVIAGVEINGTANKGSILTLTTLDEDGNARYETVREHFDEIDRWLWNARLMVNS